jgi:hypothetical protein
MDEYDEFAARLAQLVAGEAMDRARALAGRYWLEPFSGRFFHVLADRDRPNEITERDIVAVSTLGVTIPAPVSIWLLSDEGRATVTEQLTPIPSDVDIWDAGDLLAEGRELWSLWDVLKTASWPLPDPGNGMGRTKISKLLAAKRPRLVPIYDSVLEQLLPPVSNYWTAFQRALSDEKLLVNLAVAAMGEAPEGAPLLRKIDAMLWMIGKDSAE